MLPNRSFLASDKKQQAKLQARFITEETGG
jgi:hypothetical protein